MGEAVNPVTKWAGGKRKLAEKIVGLMPQKFSTYIEPFVGGGAVFFALTKEWTGKVVLGDMNVDLINFYTVLRDQPEMLIAEAKKYPHDAENFLAIRTVFNRNGPIPELFPYERAACFLYLNKTCFNGLWRVNSQGKFNVPFGRYVNPTIVDEPALLAASRRLQGVELRSDDFGTLYAARGHVVYCDPPYDTLSKTSNFTGYAAGGFTWADQIRLEASASEWKKAGAHVILSNADTPRIRELYKCWTLHEVMAARNINSKVSGRGKIKELIFT